MLPAGIASALTQSSSQPVTQTPGSGRTGRLRGLSYLRHYAHGHHHTQHSSASSGSAPPAGATSGSTTLNSNSTSLPSTEPQSPPTTRSLRQRRATAPLNNTALNSWIPTVSGVSGLSRVSSLPTAGLSTSSVHAAASGSRQTPSDPSSSSAPSHSIDQPGPADLQQPPSMAGDNPQIDPASEAPMPSIRFTPYIDMRSNRESLRFAPIERCLRTKDERIKVGRASDRDSGNPYAPVGFGSKVVSRRHCEFWCENGQWFVKDVKSSSGTFLNHIRLSAPGMESKAFPLNDGDILQLGIDFKGGEEQIFRCVKIRVELNRAWQKGVNNFNMSAHRRLRNLAKPGKDSDTSSLHSSECAICLMQVAPCQSLFVAPCSHVWHYKCIRPLIEKEYPIFLCPNCRGIADLEREIEETEELWDSIPPDSTHSPTGAVGAAAATTATAAITSEDAMISSPGASNSNAASPAPINAYGPAPPVTPPRQTTMAWRRQAVGDGLDEEGSSDNGSSGGENAHEGPMTPLNDAGPFLLDGTTRERRRDTIYMPLGMAPL